MKTTGFVQQVLILAPHRLWIQSWPTPTGIKSPAEVPECRHRSTTATKLSHTVTHWQNDFWEATAKCGTCTNNELAEYGSLTQPQQPTSPWAAVRAAVCPTWILCWSHCRGHWRRTAWPGAGQNCSAWTWIDTPETHPAGSWFCCHLGRGSDIGGGRNTARR